MAETVDALALGASGAGQSTRMPRAGATPVAPTLDLHSLYGEPRRQGSSPIGARYVRRFPSAPRIAAAVRSPSDISRLFHRKLNSSQ